MPNSTKLLASRLPSARAILLLSALACAVSGLAGCAVHNWAPGPNAQGTFSEADGRCKLLANNSGGGFYAQGTPGFVASAAAGAAIGQAIRAQNNYNACMQASGWEVADAPKPVPISYMRPDSPVPVYTGDKKDGKWNGHGVVAFADGSKYEGEFKDSMRDGRGIYTDAVNRRFSEVWSNGKLVSSNAIN